MRCTLKILNVVYPNLIPKSPGTKRRIESDPMRRKRAKSQTKTSPIHSAFHSEESKKLGSTAKTPERLDTSMERETPDSTAQNGSKSKEQTESGKKEKDFDKDDEKDEQSVYDEEMLKMLYDIIQALLVDVLSIIEKVSSLENGIGGLNFALGEQTSSLTCVYCFGKICPQKLLQSGNLKETSFVFRPKQRRLLTGVFFDKIYFEIPFISLSFNC